MSILRPWVGAAIRKVMDGFMRIGQFAPKGVPLSWYLMKRADELPMAE